MGARVSCTSAGLGVSGYPGHRWQDTGVRKRLVSDKLRPANDERGFEDATSETISVVHSLPISKCRVVIILTHPFYTHSQKSILVEHYFVLSFVPQFPIDFVHKFPIFQFSRSLEFPYRVLSLPFLFCPWPPEGTQLWAHTGWIAVYWNTIQFRELFQQANYPPRPLQVFQRFGHNFVLSEKNVLRVLTSFQLLYTQSEKRYLQWRFSDSSFWDTNLFLFPQPRYFKVQGFSKCIIPKLLLPCSFHCR